LLRKRKTAATAAQKLVRAQPKYCRMTAANCSAKRRFFAPLFPFRTGLQCFVCSRAIVKQLFRDPTEIFDFYFTTFCGNCKDKNASNKKATAKKRR